MIGEPSDEELYWQRAFITEPYYNSELNYDDYAPAYRAGYTHRQGNRHATWEESEAILQSEWERSKGASRLGWEEAIHPARAAWQRVENLNAGGDPYFGVD